MTVRVAGLDEPDAHLLSYEHASEYNGGSRWPYSHTITATHPERGEVGRVKYFTSSDRANAKIKIERLEVGNGHRRRGYGSALMDELQRQHPKSSIDHGDRTDAGKAWWSSYGEGKADRRGRTAAADGGWQFSHHHIEGPHWRSFGGPADNPRQVMTEYKLRDGGIQFGTGAVHEHQVRKHGPEAVERLHDAVREHHGLDEAPPETAAPQPTRRAPRLYYHGTTTADVTHILPAARHGQGVMFRSDTSHEHAYASLDKDAAWSYAEKAHYVTGGKPRVYQVRPMHGDHSHVEEDPMWDDVRGHSRGNYEGDRRSKVGFEVVRELKTPRHIHENFDWPGKDEGL